MGQKSRRARKTSGNCRETPGNYWTLLENMVEIVFAIKNILNYYFDIILKKKLHAKDTAAYFY